MNPPNFTVGSHAHTQTYIYDTVGSHIIYIYEIVRVYFFCIMSYVDWVSYYIHVMTCLVLHGRSIYIMECLLQTAPVISGLLHCSWPMLYIGLFKKIIYFIMVFVFVSHGHRYCKFCVICVGLNFHCIEFSCTLKWEQCTVTQDEIHFRWVSYSKS